jgi:hypothetical protein
VTDVLGALVDLNIVPEDLNTPGKLRSQLKKMGILVNLVRARSAVSPSFVVVLFI